MITGTNAHFFDLAMHLDQELTEDLEHAGNSNRLLSYARSLDSAG